MYDQLIAEAKDFAENNYLNKSELGRDEELQLLSCGYTVLFLTARANKPTADLGAAHEFIARCFEKIGDPAYAQRHLNSAESYKK